MASGRSLLLGLIVSDIVNPFFPELVKSFEECAVEQGYEVITANTNYDLARTAQRIRSLIEDRAFLDAVQSGDKTKVLSHYTDAFKTARITLAANESAQSGRPVDITD